MNNVQVIEVSRLQRVKNFVADKKYSLAVGTTMAMTGISANAADAPDFSPIITMITGLAAVVGSVGMAVLTVYATAKVFKWVKTAF